MEGTFKVEIQLGNDAMRSHWAIGNVLLQIGRRVKAGEEEGRIHDENGNTVGFFVVANP